MIFSPLTFIIISGFFATTTIGLVLLLTILRLTRLAKLEAQVVQTNTGLNTFHLQQHLQTISFSVVEIDAEVAALKQDIINTAHKLHITVDKHDTQPENPLKLPQNQERLIKVIGKQQNITTRVG